MTDAAAARTIALPVYAGLTEEEQVTVIDAVRSAVIRHADGRPGEAARLAAQAAPTATR